MEMTLVPGYGELFGKGGRPYEEWLQGIASEVVINLFIALNNELNTTEPEKVQQARLRAIVSERFTNQQIEALNNVYGAFFQRMPEYRDHVFGRMYILNLLVREFKRNEQGENFNTTPDQEFRIFMAYLQVVDEINTNIAKAWEDIFKPGTNEYQIIWPAFMDQYMFNHQADSLFELLKLLCFCKYSYDHLRASLKEYINLLGFENMGQFANSHKQLLESTLKTSPDKLFQKLNFIQPLSGTDTSHLTAQSINPLLGNPKLTLPDIRKFPLYKNYDQLYMIIDEDSYRKKVYRGPFFDIFHTTQLKNSKDFNQHCLDISKGTMEEMVFRSICSFLTKTKHEVLHFDDNSLSQPDAYHRKNKTVMMIEYKDYIFKESIVNSHDFNEIKTYIDEKFVKTPKEKPKGITQLANQIELLYNGKYSFDKEVNDYFRKGKCITIYPVIAYSDFMFSVPGVNKYLDELLKQQLAATNYKNLNIKPVTLVNIEIFYDYCLRHGSFAGFTDLVDRYREIIRNRLRKFEKEASVNNFLSARSSFDEVYQSILLEHLLKNKPDSSIVNFMTNNIGLTQEVLDETL